MIHPSIDETIIGNSQSSCFNGTYPIHFQMAVDLTSLFQSQFFRTFIGESLVFALLEFVSVRIPFLLSVRVDDVLFFWNRLSESQKLYFPKTSFT